MSPRNNAVCKCFASFTCGNAFCSIIPHATGRTAYYTAPIKALMSEKFFDMVDILGRENVGMITGDSTINTEAPVICCTAEILANQALREGPASKVGCVVMDEFHFYADPDRGWAWQVSLLTLTGAQFLLMSATLGDVRDIAAMLQERTGRPVDRCPTTTPWRLWRPRWSWACAPARRRCTSCTSPRTRP